MISLLAATMTDDENDKDNGLIGRKSLLFTAKYLYNNIIIIKLPHVRNGRFDCVNKPLVLLTISRLKIIFVVEVKSMKTAKLIVLENSR